MASLVSSLVPLQLALYFHRYYAYLVALVTVIAFIYKGMKFPYPSATIGWELACVPLLLVIELQRIFTASRGNRTESVGPLAFSVLLALFSILLSVYFFQLQTYVLRVEHIAHIINLVAVCVELLLSVLAMVIFLRKPVVY